MRKRCIWALMAIVLVAVSFAAGTRFAVSPAHDPATSLTAANPSEPTASPSDEEIGRMLAEASKAVGTYDMFFSLPGESMFAPPSSSIEPFVISCSGFLVGDASGPRNGYFMSAGHCPQVNETDARQYFHEECARMQAPQTEELPSTTPAGELLPPGGPYYEQARACPEELPAKLHERVLFYQQYDLEGSPIAGKPTDAYVVSFRRFEEGDVALLKIDGLSEHTLPVIPVCTRLPYIGQRMWSIGYPGTSVADAAGPNLPQESSDMANPADVSRTTSESCIRPDIASGEFGGEQFPFGHGPKFLGTTAPLKSRMSGGPTLILQDGTLCAAGVNSYQRDEGFFSPAPPGNFVSSLETMTGILQSNGIGTGG